MPTRIFTKRLLVAAMLLSGTAQADLVHYNFDESDNPIMLYGSDGGKLSQNGQFVTYYAGYPGGLPSIHRWDRNADTRISIGPELTAGQSYSNGAHDLSADGNILVFHTTAPLVAEDTDSAPDSYTLDFESGAIELASENTSVFSSRPKISANGRYVLDVFDEGLHIYDRETQSHRQVWQGSDISAEISYDGSVIVIEQHGNIYILEPDSGNSKQLDTAATVKGFNLSDDGRFIIYSEGPRHDNENHALQLFDRRSGLITTLLSGSKISHKQEISGDGRYVVFSTDNREIVPSTPDSDTYHLYVFDRIEHGFALVDNRDESGSIVGGLQEISADGHYITIGRSGTNGGGYIVVNPLYSSGYCEGYTEFSAD